MSFKLLSWLGACLLLVPFASAQGPAPAPISDVDATVPHKALSHYNLGKKKLAIGGRDPVAYFPEFGGKARKGSKSITAVHKGVLYRFVSVANRAAFKADPTRFEPTYGCWCAWAMADGKGDKVDPDPDSFTVEDDRLYLFYDGWFGDTRKSWRKKGSAPKLEGAADRNWLRIAGEKAPRSLVNWNVKARVALAGYDPVAYSAGTATMGSAGIEYRFEGALYRFANAANRGTFLKSPKRFEPRFGGWCAWAMARGQKTGVDPKVFEVQGGDLFLFENEAQRELWRKDSKSKVKLADQAWRRIEGQGK